MPWEELNPPSTVEAEQDAPGAERCVPICLVDRKKDVLGGRKEEHRRASHSPGVLGNSQGGDVA